MTTPENVVYGPPAPAVPAATRRRPIPAVVTALSVAGAFYLSVLLEVIVGSTYNLVSGHFGEGIGQLALIALQSTDTAVPVVIVLVIVVFLFFWGIAPIHAALRVGQVIARSVLCAIAASVILSVTLFVRVLVIFAGPQHSGLGPLSFHDLLRNAAQSSAQAADTFAQTAPLIVLGALLVWIWGRAHPSKADAAPTPARV